MQKTAMLTGWVLFIILLSITSIISQDNLDNTIQETVPDPKVYFCKTDNCSERLAYLIMTAENSVHCAFFDLDLKNIMDTLADKSGYVDVKIVIDNDNYEGIKSNVVYDDSKQYMHNKFCIIDRKIVWTGSFNPTFRGNNMNDNNAVVVFSRGLAVNYESEFDELWNRRFGSGDRTNNADFIINNISISSYFCPEDKCSLRIINELRKAKQSIYFMTFSFTHEGIADSILLSRAADIKGIFEKSQGGSRYSMYSRLKGFGIDVVKDSNPYNMHHKVFIIDNRTVITGSFNPTKNGDENNDENILIIRDKGIAEEFLDEFERVLGEGD